MRNLLVVAAALFAMVGLAEGQVCPADAAMTERVEDPAGDGAPLGRVPDIIPAQGCDGGRHCSYTAWGYTPAGVCSLSGWQCVGAPCECTVFHPEHGNLAMRGVVVH